MLPFCLLAESPESIFTAVSACYVSLFAVTFGMMNSMTYYFTEAVRETFVNERVDAHNPASSFREIDGADDWYNVSRKQHTC